MFQRLHAAGHGRMIPKSVLEPVFDQAPHPGPVLVPPPLLAGTAAVEHLPVLLDRAPDLFDALPRGCARGEYSGFPVRRRRPQQRECLDPKYYLSGWNNLEDYRLYLDTSRGYLPVYGYSVARVYYIRTKAYFVPCVIFVWLSEGDKVEFSALAS